MTVAARIELPNRRRRLVEQFDWNGRSWQPGLGSLGQF
jgi:hypothetical protein